MNRVLLLLDRVVAAHLGELQRHVENHGADAKELRGLYGELARAYGEIQALKDQLQKENVVLREEVDKASMFEEIVGTSERLRSVLSYVRQVAPTDSTVLITGETGTGKELIARAIHKSSWRSSRVFVSVNCAAIPPSLIASELFGHERGAFTGALQRRQGRFELADGGTIFLDEIGELPPETQIALLRVLQEREFERVGGERSIRTDVRVIAASNRDLEAAVAQNLFRADLFYRLNVIPLQMPALRERRGDIPILVEYFIHRYSLKAGKKIRHIRKASLDLLKSYDWPGNVRELQNVIERAVIVSDSETLAIEERWLRGIGRAPDRAPETTPTLAGTEKSAIEKALLASQGTGRRTVWRCDASGRPELDARVEDPKLQDRQDAFPAPVAGLFRLNAELSLTARFLSAVREKSASEEFPSLQTQPLRAGLRFALWIAGSHE